MAVLADGCGMGHLITSPTCTGALLLLHALVPSTGAVPATGAATESTLPCPVSMDFVRGSTRTHLTVDTSGTADSPQAAWIHREPLEPASPLRRVVVGSGRVVSQKGLMHAFDTETLDAVSRAGRLERHETSSVTDLQAGTLDRGFPRTTVLARGITHPRGVAVGAHHYVLDGGTLRRYSLTTRGARQTGAQSGFSTYRALTLLRAEKTRDVLLATTTRGALVTITAPTDRFVPRVAVLRRSGWASIDALSTAPCGTTTGLIAVDSRSGAVQSLTMGPLSSRPATTAITPHGTLATRFADTVAIPTTSVAE